MRERWMFSYVVDHDMGMAQNPVGRYCTLAHCKFSHSNKRNLVEMAEVGDWVVGTGGVSPQSAGHGRLIYAMRVTLKIPLSQYNSKPRYAGRADRSIERRAKQGRYALISEEFYYFGRNAIETAQLPRANLRQLEKRGPGYRRDFSESFISDFEQWIRRHYQVGVYGQACGGRFLKGKRASCVPLRRKAVPSSGIC